PHAVVEVGSYCGKATVALAHTALARDAATRLCSIDAHDGVVGSRDARLEHLGPTRHKLEANLARFGLAERVELHTARAEQVAWNAPIQLLVIDGLHDYASVSKDFQHFSDWVTEGGYVAFHDYADYFPGVQRFVDELLTSDEWHRERSAGSLLVVRRRRIAQSAAE
ncbi:MAG TPA: class I SAM-dependent methyltransferase, partial [Polyangiaceae bacterium]|nr:class I SAM-dependent methyltransferase [Polyangiaceae bacterium]